LARLTILFGFLLVIIAIIGYVATGHTHPTALIPAIFGLILIVSGATARTTNEKRRMLAMHIAVTVGLLGFLFTAKALWQQFELWQGVTLPLPAAIEEKAAMSALCLLFTLLCVRSFISARRVRRT
jgi:ABC-type transporter Mla maintaining outer membrane lipid asymmetry ATPase subunit MlaF